MGYKVLITGTSGMVGKGVLLECLDSPKIDKVLIVNRRSINHQHSKLEEVIHKDFSNPEAILDKMKGLDACYFCAGVSAIGLSEEKYHSLTYDLTTGFAKGFLSVNPGSVFCYVSGTGTDSSEKGRQMWARVKGKTENAILNMGFKSAYMFRPGFIQPMRGIKSATGWYNTIYMIFKPLYAILKHFPSSATNTSNVGNAMINVLDKGYDKNILGNEDINIASSN